MHAQIDTAFRSVADAEDVVKVKATPCRMLEAWALGDRAALDAVVGKKLDESQLPDDPEDLWGDEADPRSDHPKCVLARVLRSKASSDVFEELARESSPKTLRRSCPDSFAPFAAEMEAATEALAKRSA